MSSFTYCKSIDLPSCSSLIAIEYLLIGSVYFHISAELEDRLPAFPYYRRKSLSDAIENYPFPGRIDVTTSGRHKGRLNHKNKLRYTVLEKIGSSMGEHLFDKE